jgi:enoyl-CoA hydratase/carnithine racemase
MEPLADTLTPAGCCAMLSPDRLEFRFVEVARDGDLAILTINDPPANTLTYHLLLQFEAAFLEFSLDPQVRAVIITGAGGRFFCGGVNIGMLSNVSAHYKSNFLIYAGEVFDLIDRSEALVVAAINGHVTGGGLETALVADLRVAVEGTYNCGFPEVRLGVIPGLGGTQRLSRLIGARRTFELITHGDFISVAKAKELGIVDAILPRDAFLSGVLDYTRRALDQTAPRKRSSSAKTPWRHPSARLVEYQRRDRIGVITLSEQCGDVPSLQVLWALNQTILTARYEGDAEAILITHAGADFRLGVESATDDRTWEYAQYVFRRLENTPRLCVLAFRGSLAPLATELAFACDFRLSPDEGCDGVLLTIAADSTRCSSYVPRSQPRCAEVTFAQAAQWQLIKAVDAGTWPQAALAWMARFVSPRGASKAIGYAKLAIVRGTCFPEEAGRMLEWHLQEQLFRGHDAPEGMRAYLEKRTAAFKGE